jgi:hypothetical protein
VLQIYADFNNREAIDTIIMPLDIDLNAEIDERNLKAGDRVLLYAEDIECEAVLRRGMYGRWVADLDTKTFKDLPEEQWNRLERK